jgi:putative ABC transport system permease protein
MFHEIILSVKLALKNLRGNVGRTVFSLLGIVIGVTSVILVLSLGAGVKNFVVGQVTSFGTDIFNVEIKTPKTSKNSTNNAGTMVGGTTVTTLKLKDAEKVAELPNVGAWYALNLSQQVVQLENRKKQVYLMGTTAGVAEADEQVKLTDGRMYSAEDDAGLKQVAVIGSSIKTYLFGEREAVGQNIKIKGQTFEVIGVLKSRGGAGFLNFDDFIYLPLETLQKKIMGVDYIEQAIFKIQDMDKLDLTIAQANELMRDLHDIDDPDDEDFAISSVQEGLDILAKVFYTLNILLLALTSISLVVGGVGIMNVMYVSVVERTYEIGLRKSVGARNRDILLQFLLEAIFLTVIGGVVGVAIGAAVSKLAELVAANFGYILQFSITWWSMAVGFGFSAATGIIFGYYPARNASKMSPMEALRKE